MRVTGRVSGVVLAIVVAAGCVLAWLRIRQLESELDLQTATLEQVARRARLIESSTAALRQSVRESRQAAQAVSNELAQTRKQLAEERGTHEPLRQQIERMVQQDIVNRTQIEKRDRSIKDGGDVVKALRKNLETERGLAEERGRRIGELEAEVKSRSESETNLRRALDESARDVTAARSERDQARAERRDIERKLEDLARQAAAGTNGAVNAGP